jgi:hypothetical protein
MTFFYATQKKMKMENKLIFLSGFSVKNLMYPTKLRGQKSKLVLLNFD